MPLCLTDLKLKYNVQISWGDLYVTISESGDVMKMAWKDQNVVLFMSTVGMPAEKIKRLRRRPARTATNARTSRAMFGDEPTKRLKIPVFIDNYNHFMNGVNVADQLRSYYMTQRIYMKNWKALWHFLLDITITNCYKIAYTTRERPYAYPRTHETHKAFRIKLANSLFTDSWRQTYARSTNLAVVNLDPTKHLLQRISNTPKNCVICVSNKIKERRRPSMLKKPLGELSLATVKKRDNARPQAYPQSRYGYSLCNHNLCNTRICWNKHIQSIK